MRVSRSCGVWPRPASAGDRFLRVGRRTPRWSYGMLLTFIAAVSVHDAALVVLNHSVILEYEQNPIGRWLIEVQGGEVWLFVGLKLLSTSAVCASLATLHGVARQMAWVAATSLAVFQMSLLCYLTVV